MTPENTGDGGEPRRRKRRRRWPKPKAGRTESPQVAGGKPPEAGGQQPRGSSARSAVAEGRKAGADGTRKGKAGAPRRSGRRTGPRTPTVKEVSAGGVVYRRVDDRIEVILASRRTRRGDLAWGLAKGGIERDESMEDAAVREVREETGIEAVIEAPLGDTKYMYVWEDVRIRKTVHFFLMRATGGDVDDRDDEMEEVRWFPLERALKRAAYRGERDVLRRAADALG